VAGDAAVPPAVVDGAAHAVSGAGYGDAAAADDVRAAVHARGGVLPPPASAAPAVPAAATAAAQAAESDSRFQRGEPYDLDWRSPAVDGRELSSILLLSSF